MRKLNLKEMLEMLTVKELKHTAALFSLKCKSGMRKGEIIMALSRKIMDCPDWIIDCMPTYQLRWYDRILNHPELPNDIPAWLDLPFTFYCSLPAGERTATGEGVELYVATDFGELIAPLLPDAIAARQSNGQERFENEMVGLMNLCGVYKWVDIIDRIIAFSDDDDVKDALFRRFKGMEINSNNFGILYESPLANWVYRGKEILVIDKNESPEFSSDLMAAAGAFPEPLIGGEYRLRLREALMAYGRSAVEADDIILKLWRAKQRDETTTALLPDGVELKAKEFIKVFPLITDYLNNVPFWRFRGWSSAEISRKHPVKLPRSIDEIAIGPNMRAKGVTSWDQVGISSLDDLYSMVGGSPFEMGGMPESASAVSGKKPGRNDPCPCGSGKKYKNCCGR